MIVRRTRWGLALAALLLGCGHLAIAAVAISQGRWGLDALWFTSGGLAIVMPALLNMVAMRAPADDRPALAIAAFASALTALFFAVGYSVLPEPQVVVGALLFGALAVASVLPRARRA